MPDRSTPLVIGMLAFAVVFVPAAGAADTAPLDPPSRAAGQAKAALLARQARLKQSGLFLFGQENATGWGMSLEWQVVSTKEFFERTSAAGKFTSDSAQLVNDDP